VAQVVDLIVQGAGQLLTMPGRGPCVGKAMGLLGLIADGAVAVDGGVVAAVGTTSEVRASYRAPRHINAGGRVVMPGLIDAHSHVVFAGSRHDEFEQRIAGASYLDIMAAGGGIMNTVRATRRCSAAELAEMARPRLQRMLAHGTTTVEVKTGYGLTTHDELKCLQVTEELNAQQPLELVPTFLGAHAVPDEYQGRSAAYVDVVTREMLPAVREWAESRAGPDVPVLPFCDVYCDEGAFTLEETRRILEAARDVGMGLKVHADEFAHLGAARLAADLGAISADHLLRTPSEDLQAMIEAGTIGVLLPGTPFGLGLHDYADARTMIDSGLVVALGSDLNPGTCYCESMQLIMALACRFMRMTPAEAIAASTVNAAYAIGRGQDLGRLQPGAAADLIILDAVDYRELPYRFGTNLVCTVVKGGEVVVERG